MNEVTEIFNQSQKTNTITIMEETMKECTLCPRNCKANRLNHRFGYCNMSSDLVVARAALHFWEEPCISGEAGSGTVFFSGCSMGCVYCQNQNIAKGNTGQIISIERLAQIFLELQEQGANNINLVTPTHFSVQIVEAIKQARKKGLWLPIVYNCSGYECVHTLKRMEGFVDIYLPDFKYMNEEISKRYSNASNYAMYAKKAINEMVRQIGQAKFNSQGIMERGIIVRHLALPGCREDSKQILKYLYETYHNSIYLSIMNQYTPLEHVKQYPELNRRLKNKEYEELVDYAIDLGIETGFIQEGETASESFIPEFDGRGVKYNK